MGRKIIVDIDLPYERLLRKEFDSVPEAAEWLRKNPRMYEGYLDNVEVYLEPDYIDMRAAIKEVQG
ncbi:MAG: hypothetical protein EOP84_07725 [Verrucomicrobiaceae bacterium]|nr:MAG: hypothetical protein EOP84_07725 [Verrucomicrobiaceae bacterium]